MAITIGNYNFDGPHTATSALNARSGVYVVLGNHGGSSWNVVDVGESGNVRERVENHDRALCWRGRGYPRLAVAALYVPEQQRMAVESALRNQYNPPCGER